MVNKVNKDGNVFLFFLDKALEQREQWILETQESYEPIVDGLDDEPGGGCFLSLSSKSF